MVIAVPSHSLREVMLAAAPHLAPETILVSAVKGIEFETGMTMHQVLEDVLPAHHHARITCLSGPSFAREIAQRCPTVVTVACRDEAYAMAVQATLSCPWFRCYSTHDIMGVEVGGAFKNVIAIAVGMADGMKAGMNSLCFALLKDETRAASSARKSNNKAPALLAALGLGRVSECSVQ